MTQAQRLLALFEGSSRAYGETTVGRIGRNGKAEAKSFLRRGQMTEAMMQDHIDGKQGYGSVPIDVDNTARFGALDIDTYDLDLQALNREVRKLKMPFMVCRSKSGGAHLFVFLKEAVQASLLREYLNEASVILGFSGCEIFPKQDEILAERGDLGNFINMPYFNAETPTRYCLDEKGESMTLDEFLDAAEKARCHLEKFEAVKAPETDGPYPWLPPCIKHKLRNGPIDTDRNKHLFQAGFFAKMEYADDWKERLEEVNHTIFQPPLPASEVVTVQNTHSKKDYGPTCKDPAFAAYCDKANCAIGQKENSADVGGLTVIMSEPPYYFMDVNGKRVELTVDSLHSQQLWQKACLAQISFMPSTMKAPDWTALVNGLLKQAVYQEVPRELTLQGSFEDLLKQFCTGSAQAYEAAELETGKPWKDDGKYKFKLDGLINFLKLRQFTEYPKAKIQEEIKRLNNGHEFSGMQRYKKSGGKKWYSVRVWWVPVTELEGDEETLLHVQPVDDAVPF